MFFKVYCFLARALSLVADHVSSKYTEQILKRYHRISLDFPQILLPTTITTFSSSFSSLVSFVFLFSLHFFFFFLLFACVYIFLFEKNIYILIHIRLCWRVSGEKVFTRSISGNKTPFFWP